MHQLQNLSAPYLIINAMEEQPQLPTSLKIVGSNPWL